MNPVSFDTTKAAPSVPGSERLSSAQRQQLWGASREMEALFNGYLLGDLGKKLPGTDNSFGGEIYAGLFKDALSHSLADGQHNGIARQLYASMTRQAISAQPAQAKATTAETTNG